MKKCFPLLVIVILWGCSHAPIMEPVGFGPGHFLRDQGLRRGQLRELSGKMKLYYEWKDDSVSGSGRLVAFLPKLMRFEVRDMIGRLHYILAVSGNELVALYPHQKKAFLDSEAGKRYFRHFFGVDFSFPEMQWLFVGVVPDRWKVSKFESWEWDGGRGQYRARFNRNKDEVTLYIDPKTAALTEVKLDSSQAEVSISYSDYRSCCDSTPKGAAKIKLAHHVIIKNERPSTTIDLRWIDIKKPKKQPNLQIFKPKLPKGTRKILLKANDL